MAGKSDFLSNPQTILDLVDNAAQEFGDFLAVVDEEVRLTFLDLARETQSSARAAIAAGLEPGDRAAIWAPNIYEWLIAALGVLAAGGVVVPMNTRFKGAEAAYIIEKSRARILFTVTNFLDTDYVSTLRAAQIKLPSLEKIIVLRGKVGETNSEVTVESWGDYLKHGESVSIEQAKVRQSAVKPENISDIIFTSGTTGNPKGVVVTHSQSVWVYEAWTEVIGLRAGDRYLIVNPFFHTFGYKAGWMSCILRGATIIPMRMFDIDAVLKIITQEKVSVLPGPPTLLQGILDAPNRDKADLSSLRLTVTGAAAVPVTLIERLRNEMNFETIITGYGLTESTGTVAMCRYDDDPETIANFCGKAIPGTELMIIDDDGIKLPPNEPGEVVVRGYNVMQGYFEQPEETAAAIDAEGWLHTGDIGILDPRGYLKITDRKKDMFIVGGFNAYPAEIENLMARHPDIAQVAVVGEPDDRLGEVGVAFVVRRANSDPQVTPEAIVQWARTEMANYKAPRRVVFVDALPLNASGKVLKFTLREWAKNL